MRTDRTSKGRPPPPPVNRMIHAFENITFPASLSYAVGNNALRCLIYHVTIHFLMTHLLD